MQIGYARVSTDAQDLTNQREQLAAVGCTRIFAEKITGTHADRPELARMLDHLRPGDVVTVASLDRLARSTRDLLDITDDKLIIQAYLLQPLVLIAPIASDETLILVTLSKKII